MPPFNKETAPDLNASAITEHVEMLNNRAEGVDGVLVVTGYGQDSETGKDLPPVVGRFHVGDVDETVRFVKKHMGEQNLNLYMAPAVYRCGLVGLQRGSKKDIVAVTGLVADFDDENAGKYMERLPLPPSYVLETSQGRFQAFYLLDKPANPEEAEEVAKALKAHCQCDHGTADIDHVWRIPGTLNWPNKKKVDGGRSREPQLVRVVTK